MQVVLLKCLRLLFLLYYIVIIPFRLAFIPQFQIFNGAAAAIFFDYLADLFFIVDYFLQSTGANRVVPVYDSSIYGSKSAKRTLKRLFNISNGGQTNAQKANEEHISSASAYVEPFYQLISVFPVEVFAYIAGYDNYYALKAMRLFRSLYFNIYWCDVAEALEKLRIATNVGTQRIALLTLVMALVAHVMACIFYAIGLHSVGIGHTNNWVYADQLAIPDTLTGGILYLHPLSFRYLRAIYWSIQTVTSITFGDIVAHSQIETWFCIFYLLLTAGIVYLSIANLTMVISNLDSARTENRMKIIRFEKYAAYRQLPPALTHRVVSYYKHQWERLRGVDEQKILAELPSNVAEQVLHQVVRDRLLHVKTLRSLNMGCLNALTNRVESFVYSPSDAIMEGIELQEGQVFGEKALHSNYTSVYNFTAKTFCEVLLLRGPAFRHTCQMYLTAAEIDALIVAIESLDRDEAVTEGWAQFNRNLSDRGKIKNNANLRSAQHSNSILQRSGAFIKPNMSQSATPNMSVMSLFRYNSSRLSLRETLRPQLDPGSHFRRAWDLLLFCGLGFYSISCGLLIQACLRQGFVRDFTPLLIAGYIVDGLYLIDVLLCATVFSFADKGVVITDTRKIFDKFRHENGVATVMSVFPLDVILGLTVSYRIIPVLRLLKLLHVRRFEAGVANLEDALLRYLNIAASFELRRFVTLYLFLFQLCHWAACAWQLVADVSTKVFNYSSSWRNEDMHSTFFSVNYSALGGTGSYWRALYWSANVMSSIGVSDIIATNAVEMVTAVIIMFFGYLLFNTLSGAIASLMENFNRDKREFNLKVEKIRELVRYKSVSKNIETKIVRYYEYIWARYGGVDEAEVLGNLPKSLRAAVTDFVLSPLLQKIPFFDNISEPMEQMLVLFFETRIFLENDALMYAGEMGKEMFIIERGEVQVCSADRATTFATLRVGEYIGESCFIEPTKRTASAYALGYVDTYFLTRENFLKAAEKFPSEYGEIVEAIEQTLIVKAEANEAVQINNTPDKVKVRKTLMAKSAPSMRINRMLMRVKSDRDTSVEEGRAVASVGNIHPDSAFKLYWDVMICCTYLYFAFMIPLRIALMIDPAWFILDYCFDLLNLVDNYMYVAVFAIYAGGILLVEDKYIRAHYIKQRLVYDLIASIPYDFIALGFLGYQRDDLLLIRAVLRLPKLVRLGLWFHYYSQVRQVLSQFNLNSVVVSAGELLGSLLLISHWVCCGFFLFSIYGRLSGGCSPADLALYGIGCKWRGTWVQQQIESLKLPQSGGGQWTRFLTSFNWAITTSVGVSVGDVWVMNINETLYAFLVIFCALAVNGTIIGSVMSIISDASEDSTRIYRNMEVLQSYLIANNVPIELVNRSAAHLRHLATTEGSLTASQDSLFADLPHSIKLAIDAQVKTGPFLRRCPIFDFCSDEILRGISAKLQLQFNVKGDKIITGGELGYEMFFVEKGSVHVTNPDGSVLYSTLEEGAFFGETAFFFHSVRSASVIVASPFCVCLRLAKADMEYELRSADFDPVQVIQSFTNLQESNGRRNKAVTANLALAKDPKSKLFKLVGVNAESASVNWLVRLRQNLGPDCWTRVVWDCLGFGLLLYYAFTIPLYIGFLGNTMDAYYRYSVVDFLIDLYWVLDILCKAFVFSYRPDLMHDTVIADGDSIWQHYRYGGYWYVDIVASIPLEFFALVPGTTDVLLFTLRLNHLLRLPQVKNYANLVEHHIQEKAQVVFGRATVFLLRVTAVYIALNHWFTCCYFMIHRYAERDYSQTYVIADGMSTYNPVTGRHDVCTPNITFCYARSLYYVLDIMTGAGFGDIAPYTNLEYVAQIMIAIIGAFFVATFLGFCENFLADRDAKGDNTFKSKLNQLELYIKNRKLAPQTRVAILAHYTHLWRKVKSTRGEKNEILGLLSHSTAMDLSLHLQASIIATVPLIKDLPYHTQRRIAFALQPQVAVAGSYLYKAGDVGQCVYFISHGSVSIDLQADRSMLDSRGITSMQILLHKQEAHGDIHVAGDHFGEFCVVSSSGLRADSAKVLSSTEVYSLSKTDIWSIFQYLTVEQRRSFIFELMTRVGERHHITHTLSEITEPSNHDDASIKNLYRMAFEVMTEIVNELNDDTFNADDKFDVENKTFAVKKMIREASNYGAFTQRDLIDLFVGKASDDSYHMSFSASSMQARLEKANQAKSQFQSLLPFAKKKGGMAGIVKELIKRDTLAMSGSPKIEKTSPDQEKRRQVHLSKSPLLLGASIAGMKRSPNRSRSCSYEDEIPAAPPVPIGGFMDTEDSPTKEIEEKVDEQVVENESIAKAVRAFMRKSKVSIASSVPVDANSGTSPQSTEEAAGIALSTLMDYSTPTKSDMDMSEIRPASPLVASGSPVSSPRVRRGSINCSDEGAGRRTEFPQPLRRHTSFESAFRGLRKIAPVELAVPSEPTIEEDINTELTLAEQRKHRKSMEVRLESRGPEHDAQLIESAVAIARTREGNTKRGSNVRRSSLY
eukprot:gene9892-11607_t